MFVFFSPEFCDEKAKYQGKMIDEVDLIAITWYFLVAAHASSSGLL